jgi:hypothetical protein
VTRSDPDRPDDRYVVESGSSVYMCGHGSYQVRVAGSYRTLVHLTTGPLEAWKLQNLLNDRAHDDPPWPYPPSTGDQPTTGDATR